MLYSLNVIQELIRDLLIYYLESNTNVINKGAPCVPNSPPI